MRSNILRMAGAITGILMFCGSQATAAQECESSVQSINIGGASIGTNAYQLAIKLADLWSNIPGLKAVAVPGSAISNTRDLGLNRIQVGMTSMKNQYEAIRGIGGYEKYEGLRYMLPWMLAHVVWVVRADSDIYSLADLKDKHIMPGAEGSTSKEIGLLSLESVGITPESIRSTGGQMSYGAVGNNVTMMQDQQLDAMLITIPRHGMYTPIMPLENTVGVRLLPMEDETIQYVMSKMPSLTKGYVKGGIYKSQPEPYHTVAEGYAYTTRAELPEDLVYCLTRTVWENAEEIVQVNPHFYVYGNISNALDMANIPVHPGAARYYKERGLKVTQE